MKKITIFGTLAVIILLAAGVYAHGEADVERDNVDIKGQYGMMGNYRGIHEEMKNVLESGTFEDLEELRAEYNMPIIHWIEDAEDFDKAKEYHGDLENNNIAMGCHRG